MIRWTRTGAARHPARTWMIRAGIGLMTAGSLYLLGGLFGLLPLATDALAWNNLRMVAGVAILGCLLAAVGYGNE